MSNEKKAGGIFGGLAAVGAALAVALHTLGHAAEDFGHLLPELPKGDATALLHPMEHSATAVGDGLTGVARQGQGDQIFVSALCNTVAGVANGVPPDENVGDTLKSAIAERVGVNVFLPEDKLNQLEAAFRMSQWNGAIATRYVVACHNAGFS